MNRVLQHEEASKPGVYFLTGVNPETGKERVYIGEAEIAKRESLVCSIKNVNAKGRQTENGFVVLQGSEAVLDARPSTQKFPYAATLRTQLLEEGILKKEVDRLRFTTDHEFSSPSAAAAVVHGGSANGLLAWKDSKGRTLKELEEKELE